MGKIKILGEPDVKAGGVDLRVRFEYGKDDVPIEIGVHIPYTHPRQIEDELKKLYLANRPVAKSVIAGLAKEINMP